MVNVSVVMSVYNAEPYLAEAIKSILLQSYQDFEFIIIDDGSTDRSAEIVKSFDDPRIAFLQHENRGLAASLNRGIRASQGKYIARMDADDVSLPERLANQIAFLERSPDYVLVGCNGLLMDQEGVLLSKLVMPTTEDEDGRQVSQGASPFIHGSVVFRKDAALQGLLYDVDMVTLEDWALWRTLLRQGRAVNLEDVLYKYRLTPGAITTLPRKQIQQRKAIIDRIIKDGKLSEEDARTLRYLKRGVKSSDLRAAYFLRAGKVLLQDAWRPRMARKYLVQCLRADPLCWVGWANLILSYLPKSVVDKWKSSRLGHDHRSELLPEPS